MDWQPIEPFVAEDPPTPKPGTCSACKWWKDAHRKGHYPLLPDGTCTNMVATLGAHIGTGRYATCKHHEPAS